ncbi:unnamed protein product [Haemonchus placei]|uniref:Protein cereblon n=1 Tax=Haemonchus placei TaxID=6290 RepID=A0A0N4VXA6_HAEPC|nr:unnamed protein product [Haemonchus placei]
MLTAARHHLPVIQHPYSAPVREVISQTPLCDDTHDVVTVTVLNSREIPEDVLRQDYANVEYQKLEGVSFLNIPHKYQVMKHSVQVESYLDEFARQCLRRGLADALRELRIGIEEDIDRAASSSRIRCQGPVRRTVLQSSGVAPQPKPIVTYKSVSRWLFRGCPEYFIVCIHPLQRKQVNTNKKKGKVSRDDEPLNVNEAWDIPRDSPIICFVCGRRQPLDEDVSSVHPMMLVHQLASAELAELTEYNRVNPAVGRAAQSKRMACCNACYRSLYCLRHNVMPGEWT